MRKGADPNVGETDWQRIDVSPASIKVAIVQVGQVSCAVGVVRRGGVHSGVAP